MNAPCGVNTAACVTAMVAHVWEVGGAPTYANSRITRKLCSNFVQTKVPLGEVCCDWVVSHFVVGIMSKQDAPGFTLFGT